MEHVWKYLTALVLIEIATLIYLLLTISNGQINPSEFENNEVKERKQSDVGTLSRNNTNINPTFERNRRASTGLAHLKKSRSIKPKKAYHLPKNTVSLNTTQLYKTTKRDLNAKYLPFTRAEKRMQNNLHDFNIANKKLYSVSGNQTKTYSNDLSTKNRETCNISFDSESLIKAKEQLSKPYYLFRVKLNMDKFPNFPKENWDALLHWQYVLKEEKILVQLPVDFDLITFTLLYIDKEETKLEVKLMYNNNSKCFQDDFSKFLLSIRFLLWNELFFNDTNYYLCNRYYEESVWRTFQYYLTTIWVGYDLTCSEMSSKHGSYEFQVIKDLPGTSIICFLLSLQFVWIFALLDIKNRNIHVSPTSSDKKSTSDLTAQTSTPSLPAKTPTVEFTFPFLKRDRPYGPKRFFLKLLSCKCCCCCTDHTRRLIFLMWFFILVPFGICRTVLRPIFNEMSIVGPSEPILNMFPLSPVVPIFVLDILWAIVCPFLYIFLGHTAHEKFIQDNLKICSSFSEEEEDDDQTLIENNTRVSDRFTFRCYQFCKALQLTSLKKNCEDCKSCRAACSDCNCCSCICFSLVNIIRCIRGLIYCLFPIFAFNYIDACSINCVKFIRWCKEKCWDGCICLRIRSLCANIFTFCCNIIQRCGAGTCNEYGCCNRTNTYCCNHSGYGSRCRFCFENSFFDSCSNCCNAICHCVIWACKRAMQFCLNCCCFMISYLFCLRPIISTFTFLFRSFTYFVFVALPIRAHIMRIILIFITTIFYFLRYFHEIINMNAEILNYIFKLEEEQTNLLDNDASNKYRKENSNFKSIDEGMFDYIYDKLMFVKKSYYFLSLKMIVVIMYLIITMETYLTNTQYLIGTNFKDMMEFMLIIIGPYAISFFLKTNKDDFLTEDNKSEIKSAHESYKQSSDNTNAKTPLVGNTYPNTYSSL